MSTHWFYLVWKILQQNNPSHGSCLKGKIYFRRRGNQVVLLYAFESQLWCYDMLHGIAAVPGTARWKNVLASGPPNIIQGLHYSRWKIFSRIEGNVNYKIDSSGTCFYTEPMFSRMIFRCIKSMDARQGNLKGFWTLVCFWSRIAYFWYWNAAHKLFIKKLSQS